MPTQFKKTTDISDDISLNVIVAAASDEFCDSARPSPFMVQEIFAEPRASLPR
ncbi:MAG TPA: hypothetical protein VM658_06725 [bacterium]|nr:hypothetical protein [bacterium]